MQTIHPKNGNGQSWLQREQGGLPFSRSNKRFVSIFNYSDESELSEEELSEVLSDLVATAGLTSSFLSSSLELESDEDDAEDEDDELLVSSLTGFLTFTGSSAMGFRLADFSAFSSSIFVSAAGSAGAGASS